MEIFTNTSYRYLLLIVFTSVLFACGGSSGGTASTSNNAGTASGGVPKNGSTSGNNSTSDSGGAVDDGQNSENGSVIDGGNDSTNSDGDTPSSNYDAELAFEQQCYVCHKLDDPFLTQQKWQNVSALALEIETDMPPNNAASCVGECAIALAKYISAKNPKIIIGDSGASPIDTSEESLDINTLVPATGAISVLPIVINRLNRNEYNNTVSSLLGTELTPADNFPEDNFGKAFNNISKALSLSSTHLEYYDQAANALAHDFIARAMGEGLISDGGFEQSSLRGQHYKYYQAGDTFGPWSVVAGGVSIDDNARQAPTAEGEQHLDLDGGAAAGTVQQTIENLRRGGEYELSFAYANHASGEDGTSAMVSIADASKEFSVTTADIDNWRKSTLRFTATSTSHTLSFSGLKGKACCGMLIDEVALRPTATEANPVGALPCAISDGESCARGTAKSLGKRAWRRPLSDSEVEQLVALFEQGYDNRRDYSQAMQLMVRGMLMSPNFLFRPELDQSLESSALVALEPYALASRLSYFIWRSMPDEHLFNLADSGELLDEVVFRNEVKRMLNDEKASALVDNFAAQWLKFDKVSVVPRDPEAFPTFTRALVDDLRQESRLFVAELINKNAPVSELLTADYSFLNKRLAEHYGEPAIDEDAEFIKHHWAGATRSGILGHSSVLAAQSNPDKTSPVKRGKWALETLLCKAPPAPPAGIEDVDREDQANQNLTTRQLFEQHRDSSTACYSCHALMDPIGFGLENFDPIGQWRDTEEGNAIDSAGTLPDGTSFSGAQALGQVLSTSPSLALCTIEHLLSYSLGRDIKGVSDLKPGESEPVDYPLVYSIYTNTAENGHRFKDIIEEIVMSEAFLKRRGADLEVHNK